MCRAVSDKYFIKIQITVNIESLISIYMYYCCVNFFWAGAEKSYLIIRNVQSKFSI